MARTAWPTFASGDAFSASQANTYCRDNDLAYWVYQAAGDLAYAASATTLARLAIGANGSVLSPVAGVPAWVAGGLTGLLNTKGTVDFAPDQTFASSWADITGATKTLTLTATCTVLVIASVTGYNTRNGSGRVFAVRALVNGVADASPTNIANGSEDGARYESLGYVYVATGVVAGSRIVKLQCQADTGVNESNVVKYGRMIALAFCE